MIVDEHIHLGGLFGNTDYFLSCLDESNIDFVLAIPYMFEDKNIPRTLKTKRIPPWLAGSKSAMAITSYVMKSKRFSKRYIDIPPNYYVAEMVKKIPDRIYGVFWLNPNLQGVKDIEPYLLEHDFVAIKLHQVLYPCDLSLKVEEITKLSCEYKVPLLVHAASLNEIKLLIHCAEKKPDLNIIFAHLNHFEEISEEIADMHNVHFDISPLYAQSDRRLIDAIEKVGPDRLIFGSDAPCPGLQKYAVERIKKLNISDNDRQKIMGENIINLIGQRTALKKLESHIM